MNTTLTRSSSMSYSHLNQPQIVSNIDKLVRGTLSNRLNFEEIRNLLNHLYHPFMNNLDEELDYSETANAFIYSTNSIVGDSYPYDVFWDYNKTQCFIDSLSCYENDIDIKDNLWRDQEVANKEELETYIRELINHYSKLLFVYVDLKYTTEKSHLVNIETFHDHMNHIRDHIGNKKTCFEHLQGYAWALEQGDENAGLHCHLLLIYDGSERQNDYYLGKEVGEKWRRITGGIGTYYNWNTSSNKRKYDRQNLLGIGMIHRNNPLEVENAVRTALYLTKPEKSGQQLKVMIPDMRTFGHGRYRNTKRRGLSLITK